MMMAICRGSCSGFSPAASIRASPFSVIAMSGLNRFPQRELECRPDQREFPSISSPRCSGSRQGMRIVCVRSGPTETIVTGTPTWRPKKLDVIACRARAGRTIA